MRLPRGLDRLSAASLLAYQISAGSAHATLDARQSNTSNVAPLSVGASSSWLGVDGNWSTIDLRVGSPAQVVHTLVSFNLYQTWVVLPQGCSGAASPGACSISRGGIFNPANSTSWDTIGIYQFAIEDNLGYTGNARFGYEEVGLGSSTQNLPTLRNTTVGAFAVEDFYLGLFGVNPKPTNFTQLSDGSPSYLGQLKEQGLIPSLAFGYTAGASYRSVPASLTLGGVDTARYVQNNVTLQLAVDNERDTVVAIQQISTPSQQTSSPVGTNFCRTRYMPSSTAQSRNFGCRSRLAAPLSRSLDSPTTTRQSSIWSTARCTRPFSRAMLAFLSSWVPRSLADRPLPSRCPMQRLI